MTSSSSQKVILTGLPPTVTRDAILAWLAPLGPTLVSLTPGKAKSDGTQKPAHASLEFRVHPKSAHPYALVEATESLHDTLRRMPPFMDAGGVVWPVEPCWPFHTRVPGRGDTGGPGASAGSGAGAVAASRDPYEGTLEADPLWRDFQARREGPPGGSLASSSAAAAAAAGKLRDLGEGGGEDAAPKAIPALVTFLLNKSRAQASAAAASKRTAAAAAAAAAGGPRARGKGKVGGPFSGGASGGGSGGGRTAEATIDGDWRTEIGSAHV